MVFLFKNLFLRAEFIKLQMISCQKHNYLLEVQRSQIAKSLSPHSVEFLNLFPRTVLSMRYLHVVPVSVCASTRAPVFSYSPKIYMSGWIWDAKLPLTVIVCVSVSCPGELSRVFQGEVVSTGKIRALLGKIVPKENSGHWHGLDWQPVQDIRRQVGLLVLSAASRAHIHTHIHTRTSIHTYAYTYTRTHISIHTLYVWSTPTVSVMYETEMQLNSEGDIRLPPHIPRTSLSKVWLKWKGRKLRSPVEPAANLLFLQRLKRMSLP